MRTVDLWLNGGEHRAYHEVGKIQRDDTHVQIFGVGGEFLAMISTDPRCEAGLKTFVTRELAEVASSISGLRQRLV
jgi:hypothetical protein